MCLISLAMSDLIYVMVTCSIYLPKLTSTTSATWVSKALLLLLQAFNYLVLSFKQKLGGFACSIVPFLQTMVVLVNSILLTCIALDRYMAVVRIIKGQWEPGRLFCITCGVLIWGFSAAMASPMFQIYDYFKVYIVPLPDPNEDDPVLTYYVEYLCSSDKVSCG